MTSPAERSPSRRRRWLALLALAIGALLVLAWWLDRGRTVALPEAPHARIECLSYAPFRRPGETPFDPGLRVSPQRIEQDLRILRTRTGCVRTYAVHQGLEAVPAVARRLGMRVKLGAWIGRDAVANEAELRRALALARQFRDVVDLLIVGNEVLLRRELSAGALAGLLSRARRESAVPVTYADVWEFWLRNDALRAHVDAITVHVLPYWEDEPVPVERAVEHVFSIAAKVAARFPGQPVLVGETGWPAAGRQRAGAVPGRLNQARFAREFVTRAQREPLRYNFIEGFDQPWKRRLEGAMGGHWGVFDRDGDARFAWSGPLAEDDSWWAGVLAAALATAAALAAAAMRRLRWQAALALVLGWSLTTSSFVAHFAYMVDWHRTPLEWTIGAVVAVFALWCALQATGLLASRLDAPAGTPMPLVGGAWVVTGVPCLFQVLCTPSLSGRGLGLSRAVVLFAAAAIGLALAFEPRYRGFPWALLAAPAFALLALRVAGERPAAAANEERLLALVIALCAPAIAWIEGPRNLQAIGFALLLLLLAASIWPGRRQGRGRTRTIAPSSTAGAAGPAA